MSRWECFKLALSMLWLALAPSKVRKARTGSARVGTSKIERKAETELMTLEERVKKAIDNIDKALDETPSSELDKTLSMSETDYLKQQRILLVNLLERKSW